MTAAGYLDAHIYELDDTGIARRAYDDLDAVRFTRGFLEAPDRFIRRPSKK